MGTNKLNKEVSHYEDAYMYLVTPKQHLKLNS